MTAKILWAAQTWTVAVDYRMDLGSMLGALRGLQINPDLTSANFPCPEHRRRMSIVQYEVSICRCREPATTFDVIEANRRNGYRPASLEILIALVEQHSELFSQLPLFALGSEGRDGFGDPAVPYIGLIAGSVRSVRIYSPTDAPPRVADWVWQPAARLVVYSHPQEESQ